MIKPSQDTAERRARDNKVSRIIIRIPLDSSGDMDNLLAAAIIRRADQIKESASRTKRRMESGESVKRTRAEEEKQVATNMARYEALASFVQRGVMNKTSKYTIFDPDIPRVYMATNDLRQVMIRIELPLTDLEASPYQILEDVKAAFVRRAGNIRSDALKATDKPTQEYLERQAKSVLATRVKYIEAGDTHYREDGEYHLIKDQPHKSRDWTKYAGVKSEEEYLEKIR